MSQQEFKELAGYVAFTLVVLAAIFLALAGVGHARDRLHPEAAYQKHWCGKMGGQIEVYKEGVRVDCLLPGYAVEVDFADKWAQAHGQAIRYGRIFQRKRGILLILERTSDERYVEELRDDLAAAETYIRIWTITPGNLSE